MKPVMDKYDVGVIVGRFQVPYLHSAHRALIETVCEEHSRVLLFLGLAQIAATRNNPLPLDHRKQMILSEFPDVTIGYMKDVDSDEIWSKRLDRQINELLMPTESAVLYGSRDSFIDLYHGKYQARELEPESYVSGTEIRNQIAKRAKSSQDFREGMVFAAYNQYPKVVPTVDIAVFSEDYSKILMGRKADEKQWRLIGGYADPRSTSYEADAIRETHEEAGGMNLDKMIYLGSFNIDDWRYRTEVDKIRTSLFATRKLWGAPRPGDDICELKWFDTNFEEEWTLEDNFDQSLLCVPHHKEILLTALRHANQMKTTPEVKL